MTAGPLLAGLESGDFKSLYRAISIAENDPGQVHSLLKELKPNRKIPVIGITGPPGAGKSTLISKLLDHLSAIGKKTAVIAVDPSSPFHHGALLGDRIRMQNHFDNPGVFIRSVATRGAMGGLTNNIQEIVELIRCYPFDNILIETVGVGQSELEISKLADITVVVLVPESGDTIQTMKAGLMEIADIFVVNKSDRPDADRFFNNLQQEAKVPVVVTVANVGKGVEELWTAIAGQLSESINK